MSSNAVTASTLNVVGSGTGRQAIRARTVDGNYYSDWVYVSVISKYTSARNGTAKVNQKMQFKTYGDTTLGNVTVPKGADIKVYGEIRYSRENGKPDYYYVNYGSSWGFLSSENATCIDWASVWTAAVITAGIYVVAGSIFSLSDAAELIWDYNIVWDKVFRGNYGLYEGCKLLSNLAGMWIVDVAVNNPQYAAPYNRNADVVGYAKSQQGSGDYKGVDNWQEVLLKKGTYVWGGTPGQSSFYTSQKVMDQVGTDATKLYKGLQVAPDRTSGLFRAETRLYYVKQDVYVGYLTALANTKWGSGGLEQYCIQDYSTVLQPVYFREMTNLKP